MTFDTKLVPPNSDLMKRALKGQFPSVTEAAVTLATNMVDEVCDRFLLAWQVSALHTTARKHGAMYLALGREDKQRG